MQLLFYTIGCLRRVMFVRRSSERVRRSSERVRRSSECVLLIRGRVARRVCCQMDACAPRPLADTATTVSLVSANHRLHLIIRLTRVRRIAGNKIGHLCCLDVVLVRHFPGWLTRR